jgi:hypothetical protein
MARAIEQQASPDGGPVWLESTYLLAHALAR